jgi:membrane-bound lytic murein transglycosylase D
VVQTRSGRSGGVSRSRRRQKLRNARAEVRRLILDLSRKNPNRWSTEHRQIAEVIQDAGYSLSSATLKRLAGNLRHQRGIREKFRAGMIRSGRYVKRMQEIFRREGMPVELAYLPHVESSFDDRAYSHVGAAGVWQFMPSTGRLYMKINRSVDERLHPIRATSAAARLLKDNYRRLGNWPLAITAYNQGPNGIARAKRRHGPDLRVIIERHRSRTFGFAGQNFYAEFLIAVEIAQNPEKYFGSIQPDEPRSFPNIRLQANRRVGDLVSRSGVDMETLRRHNPHIRRRVWRRTGVLPAGVGLYFPPGNREQVTAALRSAPRVQLARQREAGPGEYRVRRGDSLSGIARRFGTSVAALRRNNSIRGTRIYVGEVLTVSNAKAKSGTGAQARNRTAPGAQRRTVAKANGAEVYRVRRGDSLWVIAKRFGVSPRQLQRANGIRHRDRIQAGQTLRIPQ